MKLEVLYDWCKPEQVRPGDAGLDLRARDGAVIHHTEIRKVHTGIKVAIPEGHVGLMFPRSGLGSKGLVLKNTVGVIDSNYRGEIIAMITNTTEGTFRFNKGDRIAQLVILPIYNPIIEIVDSLDSTNRGEDGFGSSGC